jgi:hypothetical protein
VLGLLAVSVGVLGFWTGVSLLRKTLGGAEEPARNHRRILTKGRGLLVVSALILATMATAGVLLYSRPVHGPLHTGPTVVVVSEVDILAGTDLNLKDDQFKLIEVPLDVVDDGADASRLRLERGVNPGRGATVAIVVASPCP